MRQGFCSWADRSVRVRRGQSDKREVPLAELYTILEQFFRSDHWLRAQSTDGWADGGVMKGIRRGIQSSVGATGGRWVANSIFYQQLARGAKLSFVYDLVTGAAEFSSLKYTLDAAKPPLRTDLDDDAEFESLYGISRRLRFRHAVPRKAWRHDVFTDIYE